MIWQIKALDHAKTENPRECCGLIVIVNGKERYWPCLNLSTEEDQFILDPESYADAEDEGEIVAVVHSHPNSEPVPSEADLVMIENTGLPWYIVNPNTEEWSEAIKPSGFKAPLVGRQWVWNVTDCWTLVRDWYAEQGLELIDFKRPSSSDEFNENPLFKQSYESAGFVELELEEELEWGDSLLLSIGSPGLNHVAVFLGDGTVLHHAGNRLSSRDIYGGWLKKSTGLRLRNPSLRRRF